jgi:tetratricopeptide (TPR) repeat protein
VNNLERDDKEKLLKSARKYFVEGEWDKSIAEYQKILAIDPDDVGIYNNLGDVYLKNYSIQAAYDSYNKATIVFLTNGQIDNAVAVYKKIINLDTAKLTSEARKRVNVIRGYVKIGEALKEERIVFAIEVMGKILKYHPEDPMVRACLMHLDNKIAQMPASVQHYQTLGDVFFENNIFKKAQEMFAKIETIDPQNIVASLRLAQVHMKNGMENEAKKEYLKLAEYAISKEDLDQAHEFAQKAIELKSVEAHYVLGLVYFKRKKWDEAVNEFQDLLRIKVNHLGALLHLGMSLEFMGKLVKAEETFQKAIKLDKDNPYVQEAWVEFCVRFKDKEMAITKLAVLLDKAVEENDAERKVKFSKMMIDLEPTLVSPRLRLIEGLEALGDLNGAADVCRRLALIHERQNQFQEAIQCLEKAIGLSPASAEVLEAALKAMKEKESRTRSGLLPESKDGKSPAREITVTGENLVLNAAEILAETQNQVSPELTSPNSIDSQLAAVRLCLQQGFLKAAIEIYKQILDANSNLSDVRNQLIEVNNLYMQEMGEKEDDRRKSARFSGDRRKSARASRKKPT